MSHQRWNRSDVDLGDLFRQGEGGLIYRVVGLIDDPVVVVVPENEHDGEEREHFVIGSERFSQFEKLEPRRPS